MAKEVNIFDTLKTPIFILAPMDDVTDTVFRQIIADLSPPDLYFTEFVNVDGLQSPGRPRLMKKLMITNKEKPIIAQVWGKNPDNFYKTAQQLADGTFQYEMNWYAKRSGLDKVQGDNEKRANRTAGTTSESRKQLTQQFAKSKSGVDSSDVKQSFVTSTLGGFAGVDINMGCPVKAVIQNGCCSALINNRQLAEDIIDATKKGAGQDFPVSVKTRLGFKEVDLTWHEFLLIKDLSMLTIHGRTVKEMSKVPANWDLIGEVRELRDKLAPNTKLVGNGDVLTKQQGQELADKYKLDGIMIGRGIFHDPLLFSGNNDWQEYSKQQRIELFAKHVKLFAKTWKSAGQQSERRTHTLNKFCKIYIQSFDGAKELREQLMAAETTDELLDLLAKA